MGKSKALTRHHRKRVIERKKQFIKKANSYWHYKFEGALNKGKIHCSCGLCAMKFKGFEGPSMSDKRKIEKLVDMEKDWLLNNA